ncbi:hypothetical protein GMLC_41100 [Geomonas limicola]|uniref:Membrane-associated sensor domain-containing protein n=1 Tax=Geomonas limicola TaxID=2740186 RepID=A0A6V8NDA4_9BACT|nr:hypothetical protein [Geomonas limicola]GFO70531.1 hypothetical protein GMLC_41100 [Geomonas limicola]
MSYQPESRPWGLSALSAAYFLFLILTMSSYGAPFPLWGRFYNGSAAQWLVFADSMISLYLWLGVLKRQQLTVWLIIGYNLFDILNACVNLARISASEYARFAESAISEDDLRLNTLVAAVLLMLLNLYVFRNRRHFYNRSLYLF